MDNYLENTLPVGVFLPNFGSSYFKILKEVCKTLHEIDHTYGQDFESIIILGKKATSLEIWQNCQKRDFFENEITKTWKSLEIFAQTMKRYSKSNRSISKYDFLSSKARKNNTIKFYSDRNTSN